MQGQNSIIEQEQKYLRYGVYGYARVPLFKNHACFWRYINRLYQTLFQGKLRVDTRVWVYEGQRVGYPYTLYDCNNNTFVHIKDTTHYFSLKKRIELIIKNVQDNYRRDYAFTEQVK